ncbi:glycosyltransferase family 2 protein [Arthrobacter sp. ERGS1:01]|uniref:glycosyltransferase family 2 protein n=1 Tax=Arthrobacter sp. ERGS1:01 TaxID=1704044 RepID=UPI0006B4E175|nr:glycosyltransferase [Arthrobacter sp. ERGS1:01]
MVAHNGSAYLPTVLTALAEQTRPATSVVAADVASSDASGEMLRKALGECNVISFEGRKGGYGAAVKAALAHQVRTRNPLPATVPAGAVSAGAVPAAGLDAGPAAATQEWIWLLTDDAAPAPTRWNGCWTPWSAPRRPRWWAASNLIGTIRAGSWTWA